MMTEPSSNSDETSFTSCWNRFKWELRLSYPLFSIKEPNGRVIDLQESFAPRKPCHSTPILRLLFLLISIQVLCDDIYTYPRHNLWIYLGYLTHWGHVLTIFYFFSSFVCSLLPHSFFHPSDTIPAFLKWTWGLYALVAPLEFAITILYWGSGIAGHVTYSSVMEHGVLGALVWIDGLLIGIVPVRAKQVWFLISVATLYLLWTIVDALLNIGNGEWGPAYNDDALYPVLNWNKQTRAAAILSAIVELIVAPAIFYLCWMASLASCKQENIDVDKEANRCCCHAGVGGTRLVCDGSRRPLYNANTDKIRQDATAQEAFDYSEIDKGAMA
jgi:hypothetical protein